MTQQVFTLDPHERLARRAAFEQEAALWMDNPIFEAAGRAACGQLASRYPSRECVAGETFFRAGEPASALHVLLSGCARIYHRVPSGLEATVKLVRAPMVFGDIEALHGVPFLESVATTETSRLAHIPAFEYEAFLRRYPASAIEHLRHLAAAFCVTARNEQQVFAPIEQRAALVLLSYARLYGRARGEAIAIAHPLSQLEIAQSLGVVRRSVAQVMGKWQKQGWLTRWKDQLILLRPRQFEELAAPLQGALCYWIEMPLGELKPQHAVVKASIEVVEGPAPLVGERIPLTDELVVGRDALCDLVLADERVSERHCRLFRAATGGRYWIEDLSSLNGTFVGGAQVTRAVLRDGVEIRIGETRLRVRLEVEPEPEA